MRASDAMIELAERRVAQEAEAGVARIRARLAGVPGSGAGASSGRLVCACGEEIPEARRRAVPHATTCTDCARLAEQRTRRRA